MDFEKILHIIEVVAQVVMASCAFLALRSWRSEILGKHQYDTLKILSEYIYGIEFVVTEGNRTSFIALRDLLNEDREEFCQHIRESGQRTPVLFAPGISELFKSINIDKNIYYTSKIRKLLQSVQPTSFNVVGKIDDGRPYIALAGAIPNKPYLAKDGWEKNLLSPLVNPEMTILEYFERWQQLEFELRKKLK